MSHTVTELVEKIREAIALGPDEERENERLRNIVRGIARSAIDGQGYCKADCEGADRALDGANRNATIHFGASWWIRGVFGDGSYTAIAVTHCPWCGKRLDPEGPDHG